MADSSKLNISIDYRLLSALLAIALVVMLAFWRPWQPQYDKDARTVTVTGETTVKATPDEYMFYPSYETQRVERATALDESTKKSNVVVAKLKELGVADNAIKTSVDGFKSYDGSNTYTYAATVTVTVTDKELAQKVQDYLVTTTPTGGVTPQPTFSEAKRKELEKSAREKATAEARQKAEQSAKNLGFTVAGVKSVNDGAGFGGYMPMPEVATRAMDAAGDSKSLTLQPGENELNYSVTVEYYIR